MDGYRPPGLRPPGLRRPSSIQVYINTVYIFYVASLRSAKVYFLSLYTIYQSCHEPVMLLMLHAVSLDQLSMKIVLKEGRGSQLSDRHKPATVKNIDSV